MLWPDEIWPQEIGALAVLDGRKVLDPDGRFQIEAVSKTVESRLHLVPRSRQLLYVPPRRLGAPLWVDAPAFDIDNHIQVLPLPAPGDEKQLLLATENLRRRRLDRSRPLWEIWVLSGMPDGRVGMYIRTHHAIADGIAGVATLGAFLDVTPDAVPTPRESWTPTASPRDVELLGDYRWLRSIKRRQRLSAVLHPVGAVRKSLAMVPAVLELFAEPTLPPTSLDLVVGPGRAFALIRSRLELVKEIARTYEAKVNDVLLTVIAGGLRTLLQSRGEAVEGVVMRIYVPVSLRHGQYSEARGNQVAQMAVPLPIGVADPVARLHQISSETARRKARTRPSVGSLPTRGIVGRAALRLIERQRVNVESADLPGPPMPLYFAGMPVLEVFPLLPLIGKVSLGVGALSYAGQFNLAAVADRDGYPDIDVFARGVRNELDALATSLTAMPSRVLTEGTERMRSSTATSQADLASALQEQ